MDTVEAKVHHHVRHMRLSEEGLHERERKIKMRMRIRRREGKKGEEEEEERQDSAGRGERERKEKLSEEHVTCPLVLIMYPLGLSELF